MNKLLDKQGLFQRDSFDQEKKWKKVKLMQNQGKHPVLVYDRVVWREKKRILLSQFYSRIFETLVTSLSKMNYFTDKENFAKI